MPGQAHPTAERMPLVGPRRALFRCPFGRPGRARSGRAPSVTDRPGRASRQRTTAPSARRRSPDRTGRPPSGGAQRRASSRSSTATPRSPARRPVEPVEHGPAEPARRRGSAIEDPHQLKGRVAEPDEPVDVPSASCRPPPAPRGRVDSSSSAAPHPDRRPRGRRGRSRAASAVSGQLGAGRPPSAVRRSRPGRVEVDRAVRDEAGEQRRPLGLVALEIARLPAEPDRELRHDAPGEVVQTIRVRRRGRRGPPAAGAGCGRARRGPTGRA